MPYYRTSYDTTVGRIQSSLKSLDLALREALITGDLSRSRMGVERNDKLAAVFVLGADASQNKIPPFIHPYLIQNFKGEDYLVTDLRLFRSSSNPYESEKSFEEGVRNKAEYALAKTRAVLNQHWLTDPESLRSQFAFAGNVFAAWLSQAIAKAYALDFHDQLRIMAVSLYYYHTLFTTETQLSDNAREVAVIHTMKSTKMPAQEVYSLFEKLGEFKDINDYCTAVWQVAENVRLKDFNLAMLLTLVRNSWYATHAKELLSVALEHPPTWITIVFTTLTERSYKSSSLYKLIELQGKRGNADEFRLNFARFMEQTVLVLESIQSQEDLVIPEFKD